jgi:hypothetical protein
VSRQSIRATYDSRETGPRYHVTTRINDHTIGFQQRIDDPFVRQTVRIDWRDALRALFTDRRLVVEVIVGGDPDVVNDVLELDSNTLIAGSTRRAAWDSKVHSMLADAAPRGDDANG